MNDGIPSQPIKTAPKKRNGKVIKFFTVEVVGVGTDLALDSNSHNYYASMSEEDRLKDLVETLAQLWAKSCHESAKNNYCYVEANKLK